MENKDQLHQIPENAQPALQDEKTSPVENEFTESLSNAETVQQQNQPNEFSILSDQPSPDFQVESLPVDHSQQTSEVFVETSEPVAIQEESHTAESASSRIESETKTSSFEESAVLDQTHADQQVLESEISVNVSSDSVTSELEVEQAAAETKAMDVKLDEQGSAAINQQEKELFDRMQELDQEHEEEEEEHSAEDQDSYDSMSREELVKQLEILLAENDINQIKAKVSQIKLTFLRKTKELRESRYMDQLNKEDEPKEQEVLTDNVEQRFNELFDIYKQKRAVYLEQLENEKLENLRKKQAILEKIKNLINSDEPLKKTYDEFRLLQEEWRKIGLVPKSEATNLWQNYHFLIEKFFDKVKINKELKDLDLKKNLEQKIQLCEKVEELLLEPSITKSFRLLQQYHEQWKEIGPVPEDKKEEIWERFKAATDKINERRREHYRNLQEELDKNYQQKLSLCEKAEALLAMENKTIRDWQERTRQFNELFKVWKTIGPAPKKYNEEIWERFKSTLDAFFAEKKEYFSKIKEQQINNYNLKLELCLQAEALKDSTDWVRTSRELIALQKRWQEIGPVPLKHSEKIWKRFRQACDEFFNRKNEHYNKIKQEEEENLRKKEELIQAVENHVFGPDRAKNLEVLKEYQRKWTEIGFVPFEHKERLHNAFRNAINRRLDQLNISSEEMSFEDYKSRIELVKSSPDGNRQLQREVNSLQKKIDQLRDDIKLWENNIGFLADTRNANLLKAEFEKKIERAKHELSVLEAKLKLITQ